MRSMPISAHKRSSTARCEHMLLNICGPGLAADSERTVFRGPARLVIASSFRGDDNVSDAFPYVLLVRELNLPAESQVEKCSAVLSPMMCAETVESSRLSFNGIATFWQGLLITIM